MGLLDVKRLIKQTRRELGDALPAGSIRQITAEDSVCIIVPLEEERELRIEHRALGERQHFIFAIHASLTLPGPVSYEPHTGSFMADDPFGRLLNGDAELLRLVQKLSSLTLLPGHRQCLVRAELVARRRLWRTSPPRVRAFLRVVDRIEAILGGVCSQTSELCPVMPGPQVGFDATEPTEPNQTVERIFSTFDELLGHSSGETGGERLKVEVDLPLRQVEVIQGCRKPITFDRQVLCPACDGRGAEPGRASPCPFCEGSGIVTRDQTVVVAIPAGGVEGLTIRLKGMGNQTAAGDAGDLFVALRLER